MSLNVGDIVKYRRLAQEIKVGIIEEVYEIKDSIEKGRIGERNYYIKVLNVEEKEEVSEEDILKRYVEFEEVEQPVQKDLQYEFNAKSSKGITEEEIPTIRLMEVFRLFKEKVSLELVTKYGDEYEIEDIDEHDFDTPFYVRIDSDLRVYHHDDIYTDERESIDYDDIEYLIYDGKKYKITQEVTKKEFNKLCDKHAYIKLNGISYQYTILGIINDEIHLKDDKIVFDLNSTKVEINYQEVEIID